MTSAEAAQYRAAGWWSDTTLSDCVRRNAASSPDKPAYVDFSLDSPDHVLTWSEFDHAATNLAHDCSTWASRPVTVLRCGTRTVGHSCPAGRDRTLRRRAVGLGARAGVREVTADPADRAADLVGQRRRAARASAAGGRRSRPALRVVAFGAALRPVRRHPPRPDGMSGLSPAGPDDVFLINSTSGTTGTAQMRCPHPESVALLPPEGGRQRRAHRRRRLSAGHPHPVRLRHLDLAHHADPPRRHDRAHRALRSRRDLRGDRSATARRCCVVSARNWR